jgi:hypothetical protein
VCEKDDCYLKFNAKRRCNVGSAKGVKLSVDTIVS